MRVTETDAGVEPSARWRTLVNAAILGTDRAGGAGWRPHEQAPWSMTSTDVAPDDAPVAMLEEAAALAIYAMAGREPIDVEENDESSTAQEPFAAEEPTCPAVASVHLKAILTGERKQLLAEWVGAAIAGRWVAPAEAMPALLRRAKTASGVERDRLFRLVGARGRWLCGQNPEWRGLIESARAEAEDVALRERWDTGDWDDRLVALRRVRATEPAEALAWIDDAWKAEPAERRVEMVRCLGDGLRAVDEDWLEPRLDDRSKNVRDVSAELLSRIEGSSLSRRMAERVGRVIVFKPGKGLLRKRKPTLEVELSDELLKDAAAKRDGLDAKAAGGKGTKAMWLTRLISLTPTRVWLEQHDDVAAWLDAAVSSDWAEAMIAGWSVAAIVQRDAGWSEPMAGWLVRQADGGKREFEGRGRWPMVAELMAVLPADRADAVIREALSVAGSKTNAEALLPLLKALPSWDASISVAVADWVSARVKASKDRYWYEFQELFSEVLAHRLDPSVEERLAKGLPIDPEKTQPWMREAIATLTDTLHFRRRMHEALRPNPDRTPPPIAEEAKT